MNCNMAWQSPQLNNYSRRIERMVIKSTLPNETAQRPLSMFITMSPGKRAKLAKSDPLAQGEK